MSRTWYHDPVLLKEVLERLPEHATLIMDGTLWHGGHTMAILNTYNALEIATSQTPPRQAEGKRNDRIQIVWVDRDLAMLQKAGMRLTDISSQIVFVKWSYADFNKIMQASEGKLFDAILLDIGVNMEHFKDGERGFSIKKDGPLDMRFDTAVWIPAHAWLATCTTNQFHTMLTNFTDFSPKRIAHTTEQFFKTDRTFMTTFALSARAKTIGMSDKVLAVFFQAIRIVVNGELDEFASFLDQFPAYLKSGWRCIVLTYHSIEDRMAKVRFKQREDEWVIRLSIKHVIQPTRQEKQRNPAARSAKMRVVEKV